MLRKIRKTSLHPMLVWHVPILLLGDKKNAIKHWELALKNLPESQKQFLPQYEAEVKKLKEGK
jgi:hypothetical protein